MYTIFTNPDMIHTNGTKDDFKIKMYYFLNIPTWSLNYTFIRNSLEPYLILKQCLGKVEAIFGL